MRHASLFSGIGGPEVAAAMLGWENVFHCEINEFGRKVLEYWFPNSESYEDITKTDFRKFRGTIDVLTGGFPCQPFSYAGKRGGQQDQRYLWPEMLRVINEVRPTWVVGENVAGIGTMVEQCRITDMGSEATLFEKSGGLHRYTAEYTFTIERICKDLESEGYSVQPMLIPACAVGAPHRRDRIFFIAHYTDCDRGGEIHKHIQSEFSDGSKPVGNGGIRNASDTSCKGLEGQNKSRSGEGRERMYIWRNLAGCCAADDLRPERRWQTFPTVSAVHRGNDGIPFDVDSLTISFSKWRTETIKAYGNAIVPQVMYRIFEAIEAIEK